MGPIAPYLTGGWPYVALFIGGTCLISVVMIVYIGVILSRGVKPGYTPNRQILLYGIPAKATIRKVWQSGTLMPGQPQIALQLEVQPPSGPPYMAEAKRVVSQREFEKFQPGMVILVKISPTDRLQVEFDRYNYKP